MSQRPPPANARADVRATWPRMQTKPRHTMTVVLTNNPAIDAVANSRELAVVSGRVSRSADTLSDGWTATIPWTPGEDPGLDRLVNPYSYALAQVYLGPRLVNTGYLYSVENDLSATGLVKNLEGAASTADLVDSTIRPEHANACFWSDIGIADFCRQILPVFGMDVVTSFPDSSYNAQFPMIQASVTDKYGNLITQLAFQRTMLATNDIYGNLLLWAAAATGNPVATLEEGKPPVTQWKIKFDGRARFGTYIVYGQDSQGAVIQSSSTDPAVPSYRCEGVTAGQCGFGNVQVTAAWKRNTQLVKALEIPLPLETWYPDDGADIWTPNTTVQVKSGKMNIPTGFEFLIRSTEHVIDGTKYTATLHVVPPNVYTDNPLQEPWRVA